MDKNQFKNKIKEIMLELLKDYELDEITTTGDVAGYLTPFAFTKKGKKGKKKIKRISTNSTGYAVVNEDLSQKDVTQIRKIIKVVLNDMFRDIWLKRNTWNRI